ncbi:MAG: hypothetical protein ACRCZK_06870, partial [Oscillospiraceae bacterium]
MFKGFIIDVIENIINLVNNIGNGIINQTPEQWNKLLYDGMMLIMKTGVMPVAYIVLALFFLLELHSVVTKTDNMQGMMGVEIPMKIIFKMIFCKWAVDSTPIILNFIYNISDTIINNIKGVFGSTGVSSAIDINALKMSVDNLTFGEEVGTMGILMIINVIV